jgi:tRNA 2-thiouridine synthesizing protein A
MLQEDTYTIKSNNMHQANRMDLKTDQNLAHDAELDCVGLFCPMPIAKTKEEIENIEVGQVLKVEADDPAAEEDISRWAKRVGHELLRLEKSGNIITFWIRRKK